MYLDHLNNTEMPVYPAITYLDCGRKGCFDMQ